ncbi:MAG: YlxR family protein [Actinomycetota bacterium]
MTCRTRRPKNELIRIVRTGEGMVVRDRSGSAPGRGAYVCRRPACIRQASGGLGRALQVSVGPRDLDTLRTEIEREIERR